MIGPRAHKLTPAQEKHAYNLATERDQGRCVRCGARGDVERDHRQNRTAFNTVVANLQCLGGPFNCGCHLWKTENPSAAILEGFAVPRWAHPELWPAWRHGVGWVIYDDAGGWQPINESTADLLMKGET